MTGSHIGYLRFGSNAERRKSNGKQRISRLAGIRLANISKPSRGLLLNAAQVKSMTGNDTLNTRFLHENSFDFHPQFKLYVNTNYLPVVTDTTLFTSGRVLFIPFDKHFEEWEQDRGLKAEFGKPYLEEIMPHIYHLHRSYGYGRNCLPMLWRTDGTLLHTR